MSDLPALTARSGGVCEFCGASNGLAASGEGADAVLLCGLCLSDAPPPGHWRCLEGAAWSVEPAVQRAVWRKLQGIEEDWARETLTIMPQPDGVEDGADAVVHRDCHGAVLAAGDTVTLVKDLPVKGAGFTAKRGTAVRGIGLVPDNPGQIEGRVEGQRIIILTEFVKKR